jgi:hypothetical protein
MRLCPCQLRNQDTLNLHYTYKIFILNPLNNNLDNHSTSLHQNKLQMKTNFKSWDVIWTPKTLKSVSQATLLNQKSHLLKWLNRNQFKLIIKEKFSRSYLLIPKSIMNTICDHQPKNNKLLILWLTNTKKSRSCIKGLQLQKW